MIKRTQAHAQQKYALQNQSTPGRKQFFQKGEMIRVNDKIYVAVHENLWPLNHDLCEEEDRYLIDSLAVSTVLSKICRISSKIQMIFFLYMYLHTLSADEKVAQAIAFKHHFL